MFRVLEITWWYYGIVVVIGLVVWRIWKKPSLGILVGYSFLILVETVLTRKPFTGSHFRLELFWSWRAWSVQRSQILSNVIMFVPVGVLAGRPWKWRGLWFAAGLSLVIEILQLVSGRGLCEFDDLFHNTIGEAVGIGFVMLVKYVYIKEECK